MTDWYEKGELPPKGNLVWVRWRDGREWKDWKEGVFKAGYDSQIWFRYGVVDHIKPSHDVEFKPLKSKQDQEREAFKKDIEPLLNSRELLYNGLTHLKYGKLQTYYSMQVIAK